MGNEAENPLVAALMQRDALTTLLIAQSQGLIQRLALLAASEKEAVAGLVIIGQAMTAYARATQPDPEVMAGFERILGTLAPTLAGRMAGSYPLQVCLGAPGTQAEVAIETACMTRQLKSLLEAVAPPADTSQRKAGASRSIPSHR
jgi:hypothetical protein